MTDQQHHDLWEALEALRDRRAHEQFLEHALRPRFHGYEPTRYESVVWVMPSRRRDCGCGPVSNDRVSAFEPYGPNPHQRGRQWRKSQPSDSPKPDKRPIPFDKDLWSRVLWGGIMLMIISVASGVVILAISPLPLAKLPLVSVLFCGFAATVGAIMAFVALQKRDSIDEDA